MAENTSTPEATIPRLKLGEYGFTGLKMTNGWIQEQSRRDLRWPESIKTFKAMAMDATIASALSFYEMMIARVNWDIQPPEEATEVEKKRAQFLRECMDDMEHTWFDFIKEVSSMYTFGYDVHEKVYRRRYRANGSRFNDGFVGIKKLAPRSQDTISRWEFSEDNRELIGLIQCLTQVQIEGRIGGSIKPEQKIPRKKFLLFRTNVRKDNPEGTSPLIGCYIAWKFRTALEEHEAIGVSRDMRGMPILRIPARYMSADATDEEKAVYEYYKNIIRNLHKNEQTGIVLPNDYDPEAKQPLFDFELTGVNGQKTYDTNAIISRWDNKILTTLFADILKMGQDKVGSFSLAGAKTNILSMAIEHRLKEIQNVLNSDLIPQLFELNGWSTERLPKFVYEDLDNIDLDEFSKFIQRVGSVNMLEYDRDVANKIRKVGGFKLKPADQPIQEKELSANRSRAGEGGATPGEGTSKSPRPKDSSVSNSENKKIKVISRDEEFTAFEYNGNSLVYMNEDYDAFVENLETK